MTTIACQEENDLQRTSNNVFRPAMAPSLAHLSAHLNPFQNASTKGSSSHISQGIKAEWQAIPNGRDELLPQLQRMYWNGIRRELIDVISTLRAWQLQGAQDVVLDNEEDEEIYGFDTFLDQVNEHSRDFAVMYGMWLHLSP